MDNTKIQLTQFSHGAGCGCKIAPNVLQKILGGGSDDNTAFSLLLSANQNNDDAAAWDLGDGTALISTTDFFTPIVDDAFDFGRIAAANAVSDVYAMGGAPILALAILGWPVNKLPAALAAEVLAGARTICKEAGIPLAGGHTIDSPEPFFGLSVNGRVNKDHLLLNSTASVGDLLYLTKPIGSGILSTAQKRGVLLPEHQQNWIKHLTTLNSVGQHLADKVKISSLTDVTGFGLLGHLIEMASGANLTAHLYYDKIPVMDGVRNYLAQRIVPDATFRNWNSYNDKTEFEKGVNVMEAFSLLPDPQTNGGLLIACPEQHSAQLESLFREANIPYTEPIGKMEAGSEKVVRVG